MIGSGDIKRFVIFIRRENFNLTQPNILDWLKNT